MGVAFGFGVLLTVCASTSFAEDIGKKHYQRGFLTAACQAAINSNPDQKDIQIEGPNGESVVCIANDSGELVNISKLVNILD